MSRLLRGLLRLFPAGFRGAFGAEITEMITREYAAARTRGRLAAAREALLTTVDLARAAIAERWNPSLAARPATLPGKDSMLEAWLADLRHALRGLRRSPGFAVVAIGTLGLAIGANTGLFAVVDTVLLRPLPYANADRVVDIAASAPGTTMPPEFAISQEFYVYYKEHSRLLEDAALYNSFTSTLRTDDRVERIRMSAPTASLFSTLGAKPILGRLPLPEDRSDVVVLSFGLWHSWFGGDSSVIGRMLQVSGSSRKVIGVMGPDFRFPVDGTLLWFPNTIDPTAITPGRFGDPMIARMKPGVTIDALTRELDRLAKDLPARYGGSPAYARIIAAHHAVVRTLADRMLGGVERPLWILLGAVIIVLLIACANVANLFFVRTEVRQRDLAVRRAIGAGRGQLIRLQMAEALVVALLAGGLAVLLARITLPALLRAAPTGVPRLADLRLDGSTLLFTLGATVLSALICGLAPALRAANPDLTRLREGGRGTTARAHWVRNGLVIGQTALALVLLIGSGLLWRSFGKLSHVDPGYDTRDIFTFQMAPEQEGLHDGPSWAQFQMAFLDRLRALPSVQSVGLIENVPLNEGTGTDRFHTETAVRPDDGTLLHFTFTAGDYFQTMHIPILRGHSFTRDEATRTGSVVVSRAAADLLWPGQDPVGHRLQVDGDSAWFTVVGLVGNVLQDDFREAPEAVIYLPLVGPGPQRWMSSSPAYVLKTPRAEEIAPTVRALVHEVAPEAPMYRIYTLAGLARDSMAQLAFTMLTLGIASLLALILGTVGLYGVLSYVVAQRTREIGVRMALGAEAGEVRRMVVLQGARVLGVGIAIGVIVALVTTRALGSLLFGVEAFDLWTFAGMSLLMISVGVLASYLPARRASSVDPIESLRGE